MSDLSTCRARASRLLGTMDRPRRRDAHALIGLACLGVLSSLGAELRAEPSPQGRPAGQDASPTASGTPADSRDDPSPSPATSLFELSRDPLLVEVLYRSPNRIAHGDSPGGAVGPNAEWEAGLGSTWFIEEQRYGADFIQAGLALGDAALVARGWRILEWGFSRQAADGSFPGTGDAFHSTSMFVEASARALLLAAEAKSPDAPQRLARLGPRLEAAAAWLTSPRVMARGDAANAPYTHRRWILAAALGETAAVLRIRALDKRGDRPREAIAALEAFAARYADEGRRLQADDGVNPEKRGADTSYQCFGILMAERYWAVCLPAQRRDQVRTSITRGLRWAASRVDARGLVSIVHDSRTGLEESRSGTIKKVDYKSMIQAFAIGATLTRDSASRDVATRLAAGRGWTR